MITQNSDEMAVTVRGLVRRYGKTEAVNGLDLDVQAGRCHALFGRNGAGKSTTIKCLINLLRPTSGTIRVFGLDPQGDEVAVKRRVGYMPEAVAVHSWMTVRDTLAYYASFRPQWNPQVEADLLDRFGLDERKKASSLSKGMRSQLGLICVLAHEPDLLLLDEPTSGLDPVVRRELLEAVIGSYLDAAPGRRTVLVSTHLISEFEGLVDDFTIIDAGRTLMTSSAEAARARIKRLHLRFPGDPPAAPLLIDGLRERTRQGRIVTFLTDQYRDELPVLAQATGAEDVRVEDLSLEEIFVEAERFSRLERAEKSEKSAPRPAGEEARS